jgi:hypothetical protein
VSHADTARVGATKASGTSPAERRPASARKPTMNHGTSRVTCTRAIVEPPRPAAERRCTSAKKSTTGPGIHARIPLIDKASNAGVAIGRTAGQALEVDGVVTINKAKGVKPGDLVRVRITDAADNDLEGVLAGDDGD